MFTVDGTQFLDNTDYILAPAYFAIVLIIALLTRNVLLRGSPLRKYFLPGLLVKIIGGLGVGIVYGFYYGSGDTFYYYRDSLTFNLSLNEGFDIYFKLLALPANTITFATYDYTKWLAFFHEPSGWMADKVYGIISIFSFHSYPAMSIIISALSFTGAWALYVTFVDMYPQLYKPLAFCILFIPSVFFWGSGVLKDSITFGCLGWVTSSSYNIFFKRKKIFSNILMLLFAGYIALKVKPYIIMSFLPALLFWIFLSYRSKIQNQFLRVISGPAIVLSSLAFGFILIKQLGAEFSQFSLENVITTAQTYQQWHSFLAQNDNASGYSLGNVSGTWQSVLRAFPLAVNVTLFRPYLWEAHSAIMFLSALENVFILGFTIYILWKNGIRRVFRAIRKNPTVFFCFFFSILFAFCVGFTAYNFGALVRYKIPCIPFYLVALVILNYITGESRRRLASEKLNRRDVFRFGSKTLRKLEPVS
jgi:hypothetical protein